MKQIKERPFALFLFLFLVIAIAGVHLISILPRSSVFFSVPSSPVQASVKIAFFGDQGLKPSSLAVLWMIKQWGADAIVHLGDFDYEDDPEVWDDMISGVLGSNFPYFGVIGNHDLQEWPSYKRKLDTRLANANLLGSCSGISGVNMVCDFKGLTLVLSGVGTYGTNHVTFIETALSKSVSPFKICAWHKNQHDYQTGDKEDEIGWDAYEVCRKYGAMITTGHTHSYARTHLMADFQNHAIDSTEAIIHLRNGTSFSTVTGTGGYEISDFPRRVPPNSPWWAAVAAESTGLTYGALLCEFFKNGDPRKAFCVMKDIKGRIWDEFEINSMT